LFKFKHNIAAGLLLPIDTASTSNIRVDFPEPETPVAATRQPTGKMTLMFFKLYELAFRTSITSRVPFLNYFLSCFVFLLCANDKGFLSFEFFQCASFNDLTAMLSRTNKTTSPAESRHERRWTCFYKQLHKQKKDFPASRLPKNTFSADGKSPENPVFKTFIRHLFVFYI